MDLPWKVYNSLLLKWQEIIFIITFIFFWLFSYNVTRDFFCNNSFEVKTIKFNRFQNWQKNLFYVSFKLVWLKHEIKNIFLPWKKFILYFKWDTQQQYFRKTNIVWIFLKYVSVSQARNLYLTISLF